MTLAQLADEPETAGDVRLVRASDVVWRSIPGTAVVLLRAADDLVVLAGTGLSLWEELAEPRSLDDVATALADRYGVTPDEVVHACRDVLDELARRGFLVRQGS